MHDFSTHKVVKCAFRDGKILNMCRKVCHFHKSDDEEAESTTTECSCMLRYV